MIQCPECRNMIPDDSAFCDQCGKELMWCPECKRPKRGTECPVCGSDLIPGRKYLASLACGAAPERQEGLPPSAVSHPLDPTADAVPPLTKSGVPENSPIFGVHTRVAAASEGTPPASALVGNGWNLPLREGIFGRTGGIWAELATCPYVSGRHGNIGAGGPTGWTLTDVGSTNGTLVNGSRLQPNVPVSIKPGDKVRIATLDFIVE